MVDSRLFVLSQTDTNLFSECKRKINDKEWEFFQSKELRSVGKMMS